jgi:hypothetical protein
MPLLPLADDHEVPFVSEQTLEDRALHLRTAAGNENDANFNIVDFTYRLQRSSVQRPFAIEFFDAVEGQKPAFVSYGSITTLNIDHETWELADVGEPESRFVVAHELYHLLFHDHQAKAFSNDPSQRIKRSKRLNEISAEWQANTFADFFLLPTHLALAFPDREAAMKSCNIDSGVVDRRFAALAELARPRPSISGDFCIRCGCFVEQRNKHRCD